MVRLETLGSNLEPQYCEKQIQNYCPHILRQEARHLIHSTDLSSFKHSLRHGRLYPQSSHAHVSHPCPCLTGGTIVVRIFQFPCRHGRASVTKPPPAMTNSISPTLGVMAVMSVSTRSCVTTLVATKPHVRANIAAIAVISVIADPPRASGAMWSVSSHTVTLSDTFTNHCSGLSPCNLTAVTTVLSILSEISSCRYAPSTSRAV